MQIQLQQFSGPLDLLLALIQDEKLNISELSLSSVTEQYMAYLDTLEDHRAEELADFLVVAARLLLLKSRTLLPQFSLEEEEGPSLESQLKLYKAFVDASKKVNRLWLAGRVGVFRFEPPRPPAEFTPPANVTLDALQNRMIELVKRLSPPKPLPQTHIDKAITLKEKLDHMRRFLAGTKEFRFHDILGEAKNKTELIVSFLAILELVKERMIHLSQDEQFGDIMVKRVL